MDCVAPKTLWPHRSIEWIDAGNIEQPITVPCGKCVPCLISKRMEWCFRLEQEYKHSKSALFVTLTYDPKHLPNDGQLDKTHLQLYFKRLRKNSGLKNIRYFAVGEYGSQFGRPHYHILLFNCETEHVVTAWKDKRGQPIGQVHIGKVTEASIAYCTKYIIQKPEQMEMKQPPFTTMSRKYGIGGHYLTDEMIAWHRNSDKNYAMRYSQKVKLPRFYRSKIWYNEKDKLRVSEKSKLHAIKKQIQIQNYWQKNYGKNWLEKMHESRDRAIARVKQKVAYTQTLDRCPIKASLRSNLANQLALHSTSRTKKGLAAASAN